jgi:hypothetical protein
MTTAKIQATKNYGLFDFNIVNRDFQPGKHKALLESLKKHGYDPARPIVCARNARGRLEVVDGQHRLNFCKQLGIPVYYVVSEHSDPRAFNTQSVGWSIHDWLKSWTCAGNRHYETLAAFVARHRLPVSTSAYLLGGSQFGIGGRIVDDVKNGSFKATHVQHAERCADAIAAIAEYFAEGRSFHFVGALSMCMRVPEFKVETLIYKIRKYPGEIRPTNQFDRYLEDIEALYNKASKTARIPLRFLAKEATKSANKTPITN